MFGYTAVSIQALRTILRDRRRQSKTIQNWDAFPCISPANRSKGQGLSLEPIDDKIRFFGAPDTIVTRQE
jgi:hypothetical protein